MESLILSYSFFTPKSLHREMRTWDLFNSEERYWYNLPALMAVNLIVYPLAKIKVHISKEIKENYLFEFLHKLEEKFDNIEIIEMDLEYINTEPTMWRYKPIFDKESDVVLCRDIDSLPNEDEIRATYFFIEKSNFYVQTLRTHTNHVIPATIMLAGLCGFRPRKIDFLKTINFDLYYNHFKNSGWGLDQNSLINIFIRDQNWTKLRFLDSPISTDYHKVGPPLIYCESLNQDFYRNNVRIDVNNILLDFLNKNTTWSGEPTDIRKQKLSDLFDVEMDDIQKVKEILLSCDQKVQNFYL